MAMPATEPLVAPKRGIRRGLQRSEYRALLVAGDIGALSVGLTISLWTWSITAGFSFTLAFVQERPVWFLAVLVWMLA